MSAIKETITIVIISVIGAFAFLGLGYSISLSAHNNQSEIADQSELLYGQESLWNFPTKSYVVTDPDTGVQYIIAMNVGNNQSVSITPRYNKDGTLYVK